MAEVYFEESCESKFNDKEIFSNRPDNLILPCVLFTHQTGNMEIDAHLEIWNNDLREKLIAICYISSAPSCGLTDEDIQRYSLRYSNQVHFLRYEVPNIDGSKGEKPDANFISRLKLFIDEVKSPTGVFPPKWQLLYPPAYPESLVAAYLILVAEQAELTVSDDELNKTRLWEDAGKQFCEEVARRKLIIPNMELVPKTEWKHPKGDNVSLCVSAIRSLFQNIEGAQPR